MKKKTINLPKTKKLLLQLLKPEANFFWVVVIYSLVISLLTLAVPIGVQTLINTVANIASTRSVIFLTLILFITLLLYAIFSALRMRVMEYYQRRIYARLASDMSRRTLFAHHDYFEAQKNTSVTQHYFDIMTLQKNLPILMVDGFALIMQMLVGFALVSFYHPILMAFNLVVLILLYLIWRIWSGGAKRTAIELSHAKYATAKWLHEIALAHDFFSSATHVNHAAKTTDKSIAHYLDKHAHHFTFTFYQAVMFLILYAAASAALLGLGGWLVIQGQISIGQLVAAELIMSAVFLGLSRFSRYLELYYELYGAADKISKALDIPQGGLVNTDKPAPQNSALSFNGVTLKHDRDSCSIDIKLEAGGKYYVDAKANWLQDKFINVLKGYEKPSEGWISIGGNALTDYDDYELTSSITLIAHSLIIECSIRDFLQLAAPTATDQQLYEALESVELLEVVNSLPEGIDTQMTVSGAPLQRVELLLLKFAAALLAHPHILIIVRSFDAVSPALRQKLLAMMSAHQTTVLYFSDPLHASGFNGTLSLDKQSQLNLTEQHGDNEVKK